MLGFLTHNDSYDSIITPTDGHLVFDGGNIIFVNNTGNECISITANHAIDIWVKQGKIQEWVNV